LRGLQDPARLARLRRCSHRHADRPRPGRRSAQGPRARRRRLCDQALRHRRRHRLCRRRPGEAAQRTRLAHAAPHRPPRPLHRPVRDRGDPLQSADPQSLRRHGLRLADALRLPLRRLGADHPGRRAVEREILASRPGRESAMMSQPLILGVGIAYLLLLFAIAWLVERRGGIGKLSGSSLVYTLSLAVYCSSWTFNGGVGRAALNGFDFLPIYLGPTLAFCLGPIVIRRMLRISKANQITSIADLIGARFGRSGGIAALVTVIAVVGLVSYIALQLRSIAQGYATLTATSPAPGSQPLPYDSALWAAAILTVFAMLFGSRSIHPGEHHPGMMVAIAAESILKLLSLTVIGVFVVYGLFHGFGDLFGRAAAVPDVAQVFAQPPDRYGFSWIAMTVLAMLATLCLPRQFQVTVVENVDERHPDRAIWQFPLYLLLINLFVLPIALAGRLLLPGNDNPDNMVLALPLLGHQPVLALVAFLGGVSAAASMVVVET